MLKISMLVKIIFLFIIIAISPQILLARTVVCESYGNRYNFCSANITGKVRLQRQLSEDDCVKGRTWGVDCDGIWVDRGCRAEFHIEHSEWHDRYGGPDRRDRPTRYMTCESYDKRYNHCPARITEGVRLIRNLSDTDCRKGKNWGYDSHGIWVDDGCRAEFEINFR